MKSSVLIAESGGSKTTWCLIKDKSVVWESIGSSLHPRFWDDKLVSELLHFLPNENWAGVDLQFYGAGCHHEKKQKDLKKLLEPIGFNNVSVSGDLKAACLATLVDQSGYCAILGSGSVLIEYNGSDVVQYFGGLGPLEGDEGAGFYFGKLVRDKYNSNTLNALQSEILKSKIKIGKEEDVSSLLQYPEVLAVYQEEFHEIHAENIHLFLTKYVKDELAPGTTLHFIGSYAFHHKKILQECLSKMELNLGSVVQYPIQILKTKYI